MKIISEDSKYTYYKEPLYHCCCFTREATGTCKCPQFTLHRKDKATGRVEDIDMRGLLRYKASLNTFWKRIRFAFSNKI